MAQYFTDFSEYSTGVQPPDWTKRMDAFTLTVESSGDATVTGGQVLRLDSPSSDGHKMASWDDVEDGNHADVEIVAKIKLPGSGNNEQIAGIAGRAAGTASTTDWYRAAHVVLTDTSELAKHVSGSYTQLGSEANTLTAGDWWWLRLRMNGTTIRAKFWKDGTSEPGSWEVDTTDSSLSAAGWVGVFAWDNDDIVDVDVFGVGTNGDAAPTSAGPDPAQASPGDVVDDICTEVPWGT